MSDVITSYVMRIYRRSPSDPRLLVGTLEEVGSKEKKHFTSFLELQEILGIQRCRTRRGKKDRGSGPPQG